MNTKHLLEEEIRKEIEEIGKLQPGTEQHKSATEALSKLLDKYNDMDKLELEYQDKFDVREAEQTMKEKQLEQVTKDCRTKNILSAVKVGGELLMTCWGICKVLKFEENGVLSSVISRGMVQKILHKK
jgi:hypothetical protein